MEVECLSHSGSLHILLEAAELRFLRTSCNLMQLPTGAFQFREARDQRSCCSTLQYPFYLRKLGLGCWEERSVIA